MIALVKVASGTDSVGVAVLSGLRFKCLNFPFRSSKAQLYQSPIARNCFA